MLAVAPLSVSKSEHVRSVFENVSHYLNNREIDIRIRIDTVREFARNETYHDILDIGCGNGSISLPLLNARSQLTWLDLSGSMLATAQRSVPNHLADHVRALEGNFITTPFDAGAFDLILCLGVLAHVDSPEEVITKIAALLRPKGALILSITDSYHFVGRFARLIGSLKEVVAPAKYRVNPLAFSCIAKVLEQNRLKLAAVYRYAEVPVPGLARVVSCELLHKLVRFIFGGSGANRNAWLGNEYICLLTLDEPPC